MSVASGYSAAVVTFQRPDSLAEVLAGLLAQSAPPALVVVADNDPLRSAESIVASAAIGTSTRVHYLPVGSNQGPAGGWARAVAWAAAQPDRGEWVMVVDDDDPIGEPSVAAALLRAAASAPSSVAAVGLRGARWRRLSASLARVNPTVGTPSQCDYLASGGVPLYRWGTIDSVGFFDQSLFFGFEDLEYGLRLRDAGHELQAVAIDVPYTVRNSAALRTPWREYFKTRALVVTVLHHCSRWALVVTIVRSVVLGAVLIAVHHRDVALLRARWRGCNDALLGQLGAIRFVPSSNPAKVAA